MSDLEMPHAPDQPSDDEPSADTPAWSPTGGPTPASYGPPPGYAPAPAGNTAPLGYSPSQGYGPQGYPAAAPYPPGYAVGAGGYPAYGPAGYTPTFAPPPGLTQQAPFGPPPPPLLSDAGPASAPPGRGPGRTLLVAVLLSALVGGGVGAVTVAAVDHNSSRSSGITVTTATAPKTPALNGSVTAAAQKVQPSVVTINVSGSSGSGTGSGIVIRPDGYILTNNHVVDIAANGGTIQVITNGGQTATGTVVGTDPSDDLAVIKVSGLGTLPSVTFASSSAVVVGQPVVAIGAPLGLSNTVTSGIISNTARPVQTGDTTSTTAVFDALQTDAAINPGNSGGPLVNLNGDVVGINAAIATADSGGVEVPGQEQAQSGSIGIGFAIPSDEASRIAAELITTGKATHAVIGVSVNSGSSSSTSIVTTLGAKVVSVNANSPGAKVGLQAGDIVTKLGNQLILTDVDLVAAVRSHAPGQKVALTYTRGGNSITVSITLGSASS